jgi:hypothetical protein
MSSNPSPTTMNRNLLIVGCAMSSAMQNPPPLTRIAQFLAPLPRPNPIVHITTPSGKMVHQFTFFTSKTTIEDVQCAIRGDQMLTYLEKCGLPAPPVPGGRYKWELSHGRELVPATHKRILFTFLLSPPVRAALEAAPTSYGDTFALRLHRQADPSTTALTPKCCLGSLGLKAGAHLDLVVTIRKDRADLDAAKAEPP